MKPKIGDTVQFKKSGITGTVEKILRGSYVVKTPTSKLSAWPEDLIIVGLSEISLDKEMDEHQKLCDEIMAIQGIEPIEAEMEEVWHCPDGYIFKDENGNVINARKIVLEKKEYPKTYEECAEVLDVCSGETLQYGDLTLSNDYEFNLYTLLENFRKLLICRDAYWKIAGEEMGLGKPWEPSDSDYITGRYCIFVNRGNIICDTPAQDCILTFPTEEMRDAFYEAFREEIEICKELL